MEYIPGGDLKHFMDEMLELEEEEALFYMCEMLLAVDALHSLGYIHRDLKPDNFLIDNQGHLKLADFGLSIKGIKDSYNEPFRGQLPVLHNSTSPPNEKKSFEKNMENGNVEKNLEKPRNSTKSRKEARMRKSRKNAYSLVGSPDYMAVEILRGQGYDWTVDWWSLGCILFE